MKHSIYVLLAFLTCICNEINARGGRGRGGGSMGGLFGGWRKYKKPSSSGSSRRFISGSPMQSVMSSSVSFSSISKSEVKSSVQNKPKINYPKQEASTGYHPGFQSYPDNNNDVSAGILHAKGTFYTNVDALPSNAILIAQPPIRASSTGDFLLSMLTAHIMNKMLLGHNHHHITQIYRNQPEKETIDAEVNNETTKTKQSYWPMAAVVPLAPLNDSESAAIAISKPQDNLSEPRSEVQNYSATANNTQSLPPQSSIICFFVIINETDTNDQYQLVKEVTKIVCFPAPVKAEYDECITRTYTEPGPSYPEKIIQVQRQQHQRQQCTPVSSITNTESPVVAGDIKVDDVATFVNKVMATWTAKSSEN